MRRMGIEALYRKRNTSRKHPDHQVFPYLLRNVVIDRPNHVYEEVYRHAYETVADARSGIAAYIDFYNRERPHSSLDKQTPDEAYDRQSSLQAA
jgi:transposase InsO family protein